MTARFWNWRPNWNCFRLQSLFLTQWRVYQKKRKKNWREKHGTRIHLTTLAHKETSQRWCRIDAGLTGPEWNRALSHAMFLVLKSVVGEVGQFGHDCRWVGRRRRTCCVSSSSVYVGIKGNEPSSISVRIPVALHRNFAFRLLNFIFRFFKN